MDTHLVDRAAALDRAALLLGAQDCAGAESIYRAQLATDPNDAEMLSNLGAALNAVGRRAEAEQACRQALAARPGYWAAAANLAEALHGQHRQREAMAAYTAALNANPRNAAAWSNAGVCLRDLDNLPAALQAGRAAVTLAPDDADAHCNLAMTLLTAGELREGFAEYEWRWRCRRMRPHNHTAPQWRGEDPRGRTILVHAEGGFGDTLQFIRYVPMLARAGAHVVVQVQQALQSLLARNLAGMAQVIAGEAVPPHDMQCPMLSLPAAFGTTLETVPATPQYLAADAGAAARAAARLAGLQGCRIGLAWSGSPHLGQPELRAMNDCRSMHLADLAPLFDVPGASLISLQHARDPRRETPALAARLFDPMQDVQNFDDTAALVAALDLVVTVDTAVAHLAAALGRTVIVLSRHNACWRWLRGRSDNPWYPTLRHYRQAAPGDWSVPVAQMLREIRKRAAAHERAN